MNNKFLFAGMGYIAFMVGFAAGVVGQSYDGGVYSVMLPFTMSAVVGFPFVLGLLAGKGVRP